ncbi:related to ERG28 involved in synthesis of ergosterol [Lecanosticta acicola]|uniref:Related to ERG28 involved in synthesis of ergosterol n=1 Tax=Lecanosticta acicola TaxID=111012 RepID=A0AAI8Z8S9_9PEZI|nr:related to ERG28 involved in synthesis of ergosterol [Lecanosticta acicola]
MSQLGALASYLPPADGLLPKWLLFIAIVSIGNSIQCYVSLSGSRQVYSGISNTTQSTPSTSNQVKSTTNSPVNELSARTFGTWTALSSIIRLYTAYNIHDPILYQICLWTYGLAFAHFLGEWLVFGSARWGKGLASPVIVSTVTGAWMLAQWSEYVQ